MDGFQWKIMENPSINGWSGGTPIYGNPHISFCIAKLRAFSQVDKELTDPKAMNMGWLWDDGLAGGRSAKTSAARRCPVEQSERARGALVSWTDLLVCLFHLWLVVWNINFIFPYIGLLIIPIDFHIFQRGGPTTNQHLFIHFFEDHLGSIWPMNWEDVL